MSDSGLSYCSEQAGYGTDDEPAVLSPKQEVLDLLSDTKPGESVASGKIEFVNMSSETIKALEKKETAKQKRRKREQRKRNEKKAAMQDPEQTKSKKQKNLQNVNLKKSAIDTHKAKKQKIQPADKDDDDNDNNKELRLKVTAYIYIQEPPQLAPCSSGQPKGNNKVEVTPAIPKGPFFFYTDQTYDNFKRILAKELPCKPKLLPLEQMMWRYEKPANNPKKPLSSVSGYEALLISLAGKKAEHVICISMPPPKANSATWDTGKGDHIKKPYDHYKEVTPMVLGIQDMSAKEQIANIVSNSGGHRRQLEDQYPIGNCPIFPQMRIYQRSISKT